MTISDRVKHVRKDLLHMAQDEFGEKIGIKKSALSQIENGKCALTERTLIAICKEFSVSELWLREGEGDPFIKMDDEDVIMEAVGRIMSEDSTRRRVIAFLSKMPPDKWELLETLAHEMYDAIKKD